MKGKCEDCHYSIIPMGDWFFYNSTGPCFCSLCCDYRKQVNFKRCTCRDLEEKLHRFHSVVFPKAYPCTMIGKCSDCHLSLLNMRDWMYHNTIQKSLCVCSICSKMGEEMVFRRCRCIDRKKKPSFPLAFSTRRGEE